MLIPILIAGCMTSAPPTQNADQVLSERMTRLESATDDVGTGLSQFREMFNDQRYMEINSKLDMLVANSARAVEKSEQALKEAERKAGATVAQQTGLAGTAIAMGIGGVAYGKRRSTNGDSE